MVMETNTIKIFFCKELNYKWQNKGNNSQKIKNKLLLIPPPKKLKLFINLTAWRVDPWLPFQLHLPQLLLLSHLHCPCTVCKSEWIPFISFSNSSLCHTHTETPLSCLVCYSWRIIIKECFNTLIWHSFFNQLHYFTHHYIFVCLNPMLWCPWSLEFFSFFLTNPEPSAVPDTSLSH